MHGDGHDPRTARPDRDRPRGGRVPAAPDGGRFAGALDRRPGRLALDRRQDHRGAGAAHRALDCSAPRWRSSLWARFLFWLNRLYMRVTVGPSAVEADEDEEPTSPAGSAARSSRMLVVSLLIALGAHALLVLRATRRTRTSRPGRPQYQAESRSRGGSRRSPASRPSRSGIVAPELPQQVVEDRRADARRPPPAALNAARVAGRTSPSAPRATRPERRASRISTLSADTSHDSGSMTSSQPRRSAIFANRNAFFASGSE